MEMLDRHTVMIDSTLMTRITHDDRVDLSIEPLDMSHTPTRTTRDTDDTPLTSIGPELSEMIRMTISKIHQSLDETLYRDHISSLYRYQRLMLEILDLSRYLEEVRGEYPDIRCRLAHLPDV
jgi:hypothetical protein